MTQTQTNVCSKCGKPTRNLLPDSACPKCLMALAMDGGSPTTAPNSDASIDQAHVPPVEKLVAVFPNLEIQHLIGHGGMGAVYQARQVNLDRIVALKILAPRLSSDPAFAERFLREARTLAKLSHPNIVTVFDFGKAGEFYYLTMEFVDGVNLRDTISANLLSPTQALGIVPQVCDALQYAHDNGVVHRDIKPENILIAKNGTIKIADFGLAKLLQPTPEQFTLTGTRQVLGTRNYMAPEQIESPDVVDHRADLYSLGVVFYELLTGELPLGRFSLPSEKSAAVSSRLDEVVMRTLEKDPGRRFQQASQIKSACESIEKSAPQASTPEARFNDDHKESARVQICQPFPFTIQDIFASLATGYGLMRCFETHLEMEYEIRDSVVDHKWGAAKVHVPLERIIWITLHQGLISTYIDIQCDRFEAVSEIPNSKQGLFRIYLKKAHRESAEELVRYVYDILGKSRSSGQAKPMPPVKGSNYDSHFGSEKKNQGILGAILLTLFLGFCCLVVFVVVGGSIWMSMEREPTGRAVDVQSSDFIGKKEVGIAVKQSLSERESLRMVEAPTEPKAVSNSDSTSVTEISSEDQTTTVEKK